MLRHKLIKVKDRRGMSLNYVNLDSVVDISYFDKMVCINLSDDRFINKVCNSELEAQMIFAKLKNYFGVNEELSELLDDAYLSKL